VKRDINAYHLGATLYLPAIHKNLFAVAVEGKYAQAKSIIIDFEDAIFDDDLQTADKNLIAVLQKLPKQDLLIFIRSRSIKHLESLLSLENINKIDGFVLAKCDTQNMQDYFSLISDKAFWLMPVLESREVFDNSKLTIIKNFFMEHQERILSLRFGGEDLSSYLGLKRQCEDILYDFHALKHLLSTLVLLFKSEGFNITAPVFACFKNEAGFLKEVAEDLKMGLFGKTVIHPSQIALAHKTYAITTQELEQAKKVLSKDATAIMASDGMMLETIPHRRWAKGMMTRKELYGVI